MASIESDDDDFLLVAKGTLASPGKSLKRLKKGVAKKLQTDESCSGKQDEHKHQGAGKASSSISHNELQSTMGIEFADAGHKHVKAILETESNIEGKACDFSDEGEEGPESDEISDAAQENDDLEELVDEDDEEAILNLLAKGRRVLEDSTQKPLDAATTESPAENDFAARGKARMAELDEMHAQSQRLLRETICVSFRPQQPAGKSISSVLEKIRMRKLQLAQGSEKKLLSFLQESVSSVIPSGNDFSNKDSFVHLCNDEAEMKLDESFRHEEDADILLGNVGLDGGTCRNNNLESTSNHFLGSGDAFRAPMEDTQDLLCRSQPYDDEDLGENVATNLEDGVLGCIPQLNLHLHTETQDNIEHWLDESSNKENLDPSIRERNEVLHLGTAPAIRSLIDDEAEDEDEDLVGVEDEEDPDEGEDLKDLVAHGTQEEAGDVHKRAELHRKWLEQQDALITDDILLRLKSGWVPRETRKRGLDFLEEDDHIFAEGDVGEQKQVEEARLKTAIHKLSEFPDDNDQDLNALKDEDCQDETKVPKACIEIDEMHELSDDEEAEQRVLRQRFFEESEEQEEFILPAEDETSREVYELINKVNVPTHKKIKKGSVGSRSLGEISKSNSCKIPKSSFLRRTASPSLQLAQRQSSSGSGTRSFIFGRDDNNSCHSLSTNGDHLEMELKENLEPLQGPRKDGPEIWPGGMPVKNNQKHNKELRSGPSLFEILKLQATDLDQALQKKNRDATGGKVVPIFTAFRPKSNRAPRGT